MKRPNRKEYIGKATKIQLIADQEKYIDFIEKQLEAINYSQCCKEFADGKCKPMVNADWTYLRCECGKRFEPKG